MTAGSRSGALRRWIAFNTVGAIGIAVQLAALMCLTRLGWNYLFATAAAVEAAIIHNFVWHQRWTWSERRAAGRGSLWVRFVRFHLANGALSFGGNLLLMRLFAGVLGMDLLYANLTAIAICSILNFLAADRLVFRACISGGSEPPDVVQSALRPSSDRNVHEYRGQHEGIRSGSAGHQGKNGISRGGPTPGWALPLGHLCPAVFCHHRKLH